MKTFRLFATLAFLTAAATASAGELKLTIANGRATLIAQDVPARQILQEWARIGGTKIVNGEKVMGPLLTVTMIDRPEREVLDLVLRSASGYVAAPRVEFVPNQSLYDRIMILATSAAPAYTPSAMPPAPTFTRPPTQIVDDEPVEQPNVMPPGAQPGPQTMPVPGMPNQPVPQGVNPNQPLTAPRPGMLPPAPTGPANPFVPNQPPPVTKPGGGTIIR
jgi:hypothetical protein